jgi:tRNA pseudouridine13 synthase
MEVFDDSERAIGISAYLSQHEGFAAAVKSRYSDFIVHEVNIQGEIARLVSLENNLKGDEISAVSDRKRSMSKSEDLNEAKRNKLDDKVITTDRHLKNDNSKSAPFQEIQLKLAALVGEEVGQQVVALIRHWESSSEEEAQPHQHEKFITLPLIQDKDIRKAIHMLIKSDLMNAFVLADTLDKHVRIWHRKFEKEMPNYGKFEHDAAHEKRLKEKWPKDRPDYLQFVLYKENIDTATAAKDIANIVRLKSPQGNNPKWKHQKHNKGGSMGYAGMKDKRGVTSQFCTVYRKTPEQMLVLNQDRNQSSRQQHGGGNSNTGGGALMRVGHFKYVESDLRIGCLGGNRFDVVLRNVCLNSSVIISSEERVLKTTQILRVAAKSLKETGFINYFGMQRFGKFKDTHLVGIAALSGNFEEACDIIMRLKPHEHEKNIDARTKWANRFVGINMQDERSVKDAEMKAAKVVAGELGRFMNCEQSIVNSLSRYPREYKRAFASITRPMRSMFFHAYQSFLWNKMASHRISELGSQDVCLGDLVLVEDSDLENSGLKGKKVKEVDQDDIELCKYKMTDVVIPLVGTKVQYPTNSNGTYLNELLAQDGLSKESFANVDDHNLVLGGDYRRLICKPTDFDFQIKLYKDPLQPLVQTDLMSLHSVSLDCLDVTDPTDSAFDADDKLLIGLKVGFTLPPSAYATILLRELTKRPTSADYQSELLLEGDCEADVGKKAAEKRKTNCTKITIGASFR